MLITQLKPKDSITPLLKGKTVIINCEGCKEVYFPENDIAELQKDITATVSVTADYICDPENLRLRMKKHESEINSADTILVFSCGVGVQTVSENYINKKVCAGCDTFPLPGFQGVTPLEHECNQCGECYLNYTGAICPITACSKSLVNGQCGGAKDGKCEVDSEMECGWERIYRRLEKLNLLDTLRYPVKVRSYDNDVHVSA